MLDPVSRPPRTAETPWPQIADLPCAFRHHPHTALFKQTNADFVVDEILPFTCEGDGEHRYLRIRKSGCNTLWLRDQLAKFANLPTREVGYAGLKDRHALTTQWFSVPIRQGQRDWSAFTESLPDVQIVESHRHRRKLRIGVLQGNRFDITLQQVQGDQSNIQPLLDSIRVQGVPNYFMAQRFGHGMGNLDTALQLFRSEIRVQNKKKRGIYLSAARSFLFNQVLAARVAQDTWSQALPGDVFFLAGTTRLVWDHAQPETFRARCAVFDVHPSGPLWGQGTLPTAGVVAALETAAMQAYATFCHGLENVGMAQERRALRLMVQDLDHTWLDPATLKLSFTLGRGGYATAVLRELFALREHPSEAHTSGNSGA